MNRKVILYFQKEKNKQKEYTKESWSTGKIFFFTNKFYVCVGFVFKEAKMSVTKGCMISILLSSLHNALLVNLEELPLIHDKNSQFTKDKKQNSILVIHFSIVLIFVIPRQKC